MIEITNATDLTRLRRLALASQGLLQAAPYGRGPAAVQRAIRHIGYVQVDSISVVERAHHHVIYSRVPDFNPATTNKLLLDRKIFEYWTHAAAFLPIEDYRFSLPYKHAIRSGQTHWFRDRDTKLMAELLARVGSDGPIRSRDLEARQRKGTGWWDWKPAKRALEQLYMEGELMVSNRHGFHKEYDLTERVLPSRVRSDMPSMDEFAQHLVDQQLRCHGFATVKGLTYQRRSPALRTAVKMLVSARLAQGDLEQGRVRSGEVFVWEAGLLERRLAPLKNRLLILSPFDNSVIQRDRIRAVFNYDYQLECYLPAVRRRYGYFCLPLLYRDQFIGRMDCKSHRKLRQLEIRALHFESDGEDEAVLVTAFVEALRRFCRFQQCDSVALIDVYPGRRSKLLRKAMQNLA